MPNKNSPSERESVKSGEDFYKKNNVYSIQNIMTP